MKKTSERRRGEQNKQNEQQPVYQQLKLIPSKPKPIKKQEFKAAEASQPWDKNWDQQGE